VIACLGSQAQQKNGFVFFDVFSKCFILPYPRIKRLFVTVINGIMLTRQSL